MCGKDHRHCMCLSDAFNLVVRQIRNPKTMMNARMATVYKVEVVSHWISYSKEELEKILTEAVKKTEREKGNEIQIKVEERK